MDLIFVNLCLLDCLLYRWTVKKNWSRFKMRTAAQIALKRGDVLALLYTILENDDTHSTNQRSVFSLENTSTIFTISELKQIKKDSGLDTVVKRHHASGLLYLKVTSTDHLNTIIYRQLNNILSLRSFILRCTIIRCKPVRTLRSASYIGDT